MITYLTQNEMKYFASIAKGKKILEIGTFDGGSASIFCSNGAKEVVTIDIFEPEKITTEGGKSEYTELFKKHSIRYEEVIERLSKFKNCKVIKGDSGEVLKSLPENYYDFIFIDGDHTYEGAKSDYELCKKLVKKNGIIAFHDCQPKFPGVMKAVSEVDMNKKDQIDSLSIFKNGHTITVEIPTKNRYFSTLPMTLIGVAQQTVVPDKVLIIDDSDSNVDIRKIPIYQYIIGLFSIKNIEWEVIFGKKKGQVLSHQTALEYAKTEMIFRLDDDLVLDNNVIETMIDTFDKNKDAGAVGVLIHHTDRPILDLPLNAKGKIIPCLESQPVEWYNHPDGEIKEVEHLYSAYMYKKDLGIKAGGYPMYLSPVGHHEETIFSHKIFRLGYKLLVNPNSKMYHFRNPEGGIRSYTDNKLWEDDHVKYINQLKEWGYNWKNEKHVILENGMGDHIIFKKVLQDMKNKFKDDRIIVFCCYKEIFEDDNVDLYPLSVARDMFGHTCDFHNVYAWCKKNNWNKSLEDAYREMYLEGNLK